MKTYIHTIDGKPGAYDGSQICYCSRTWPVQPVAYSKLLRQRRATIKWRKANRFPLDAEYAHLPVIPS